MNYIHGLYLLANGKIFTALILIFFISIALSKIVLIREKQFEAAKSISELFQNLLIILVTFTMRIILELLGYGWIGDTITLLLVLDYFIAITESASTLGVVWADTLLEKIQTIKNKTL